MRENILMIFAFLLLMAGFFSSGITDVTGGAVTGVSADMHTYQDRSRADIYGFEKTGLGDVNCDSKVTWEDVRYAEQIAAQNRKVSRLAGATNRPVQDCYGGSAETETMVPQYVWRADLDKDGDVDLTDAMHLRRSVKEPVVSERIRINLNGMWNCPIGEVGVQTCRFGELCTCKELFGKSGLAAWSCDACTEGSQCVVKGHNDAICRSRTI